MLMQSSALAVITIFSVKELLLSQKLHEKHPERKSFINPCRRIKATKTIEFNFISPQQHNIKNTQIFKSHVSIREQDTQNNQNGQKRNKEKRMKKKSIMLSTEFIHHHRFARKMYALFTSGHSSQARQQRKNPSFVFSASLLLRVVYCTVVRVDTLPRRAQSNMMTLILSAEALNIIKNVRVDIISLEIFFSISQKL